MEYRKSSSRNRIEPSHESIGSVERIPARGYMDYAPDRLIPNIKPNDSFKEDVLNIVNPLLAQLRKELAGSEESKQPTTPRTQVQPKPSSEVSNDDLVKLERKLEKLQNEISSIPKAPASNDSALKDMVKKVEARVGKLEAVKSMEKLNPNANIDLNQELGQLESQIDDNKEAIETVEAKFGKIEKSVSG